jgi:hypothetical protein
VFFFFLFSLYPEDFASNHSFRGGGRGAALGHDIAPKRLMYTCVSVTTQEKRRNNDRLTRQQNIQKKKNNKKSVENESKLALHPPTWPRHLF